jgi:hypothetical protein
VDLESGYSVERRTDAGEWVEIATLASNTISFSDTELMPATTYFYRIRALGTAGDSPFSVEVEARTQDAPSSGNGLTIQVLGADANGLHLSIRGDSGQGFKVERTTDFINWTEVTNATLSSASIDMTLSSEASGEVGSGFFRTVNTE